MYGCRPEVADADEYYALGVVERGTGKSPIGLGKLVKLAPTTTLTFVLLAIFPVGSSAAFGWETTIILPSGSSAQAADYGVHASSHRLTKPRTDLQLPVSVNTT